MPSAVCRRHRWRRAAKIVAELAHHMRTALTLNPVQHLRYRRSIATPPAPRLRRSLSASPVRFFGGSSSRKSVCYPRSPVNLQALPSTVASTARGRRGRPPKRAEGLGLRPDAGGNVDASKRAPLSDYLNLHARASLLGFRVILDDRVEAGVVIEVLRYVAGHAFVAYSRLDGCGSQICRS